MKTLIGLILVLGFTGCQTLSKQECEQNDWQSIGQRDALAGRPASVFDGYHSQCQKQNVELNEDAYISGFTAGSKLFCTAENGERFGHDGGTYASSCPKNLEPAFLAGYSIAHREYEVEQREEDVRRREERVASEEEQLEWKRDVLSDRHTHECTFDSDCGRHRHCSMTSVCGRGNCETLRVCE